METWAQKKLIMIGVGIIVLVIGYTWWSTPLVVTVTGTGEVKVPATTATLTFQIAETNSSPVVAVTNLEGKAEQMRQLLIQNGVNNDDIVESQPQVVPAGLVVTNATGYMATMTMGGKTQTINNIAQMAAVFYEKGASVVSQPVLSVDDQETYEKQALQKAMQDAQKQAGDLAWKNWKLFRKIAAISQTTQAAGTVTNRIQTSVTDQPAAETPTAIPSSDNITVAKTVDVTYRMW
jgi:uncharacterized protein YggE